MSRCLLAPFNIMAVARARAWQKHYGTPPHSELNYVKISLAQAVVRSIYSVWDEWGSSGTRQSINAGNLTARAFSPLMQQTDLVLCSKRVVMGIRGRSANLQAVSTSTLFNFPVCIMGSLVLPEGPLECHRSDPSVAYFEGARPTAAGAHHLPGQVSLARYELPIFPLMFTKKMPAAALREWQGCRANESRTLNF
jgi:hypothetical protein